MASVHSRLSTTDRKDSINQKPADSTLFTVDALTAKGGAVSGAGGQHDYKDLWRADLKSDKPREMAQLINLQVSSEVNNTCGNSDYERIRKTTFSSCRTVFLTFCKLAVTSVS